MPVGNPVEPSSPALIAPTIRIGVLDMALLAFGSVAVIGQVRRRGVAVIRRRQR
ncbi:MAG: hypothetical protein M3083_09475 [Actinomycetota bacterium]|nr:hypothetical protein [Actinomycetota bacterium]